MNPESLGFGLGAGLLGPFCAFLSSCTWAIGSAKYAQVSRDHTPFAVNFTRAAIALPCFLLTALVLGGGPAGAGELFGQLGWHHLGWFTLSMICSYGVADVLFIWSTRSLGVPGALAVASCYPLVTALGSVLGGGERISATQALGLFAMVAGVVTVILFVPERAPSPAHTRLGERLSNPRAGVALAGVTAVLWAGNSYAVARGGADIAAPVGNALRMVLAMAITFTLGRRIAPGQPILLPASALRRAGWIFLLEAYGGSMVFMYGLAHSPLVLGSALTSLAPVISVPVALALGLEKPSFLRTLGVATVVAGLWLLTTGGA